MDKPWYIGGRVLVITDIHQNLNWANTILATEKGQYDHLLLNGDMMDTFNEQAASARETGEWYAKLITEGADVHLGNHDAAYLESFSAAKYYKRKRVLLNQCSGFTQNKSIEFAKAMSKELWEQVTMFHVVNGWLVSHAGFHHSYWNPYLHLDDCLEDLWNQSLAALQAVKLGQPHPLLTAGEARGGLHGATGGPLWKDFFDEPGQNLPLPQLVGHTTTTQPIAARGNCVDFDAHQSTYCVIQEDGVAIFKRVDYAGQVRQIASIKL